MKTLALLLLAFTGYSQNTTIHFYYGSDNNTGAEVMFAIRGTESSCIGGGFSGALKQKPVLPGHINEYDLRQKINKSFSEKWCSLYGVGSLGFLGPALIKYKGGLAVYNRKIDFESANGYEYTKIDRVEYKPLLGISAMCSITQDIGIEAGFDNFNKATIGFTILF